MERHANLSWEVRKQFLEFEIRPEGEGYCGEGGRHFPGTGEGSVLDD